MTPPSDSNGQLPQEEAAGDPSAAGAQNRANSTGSGAQHVGATERLGEGQEKR